MAEQPPPPYPGTELEKTKLQLAAGGGGPPSAPPVDTQGDVPTVYPPQYPTSSPYPPQPDTQGQSPQPTPYPYPAQPYPTAGQPPPAGASGYPASAPPSSAPAGQVTNVGGTVTYSVPPPSYGISSTRDYNRKHTIAFFVLCGVSFGIFIVVAALATGLSVGLSTR